MNYDPLLSKAIRLARRGRFDGAITALEGGEDGYRRSYTYYYLLGLAYLHRGIINRAYTCFKAARDLRMREPGVLLALAAIYLGRGDTGRAVDFYLEVQDQEPGNRIARRGLRIIRARAENIAPWLESGGIKKLYPPLPKLPLSPRSVLTPLGIGLGVLALVFAILARTGALPPPFGPPPKRQFVPEAVLEKADRDRPVQNEGAFRYPLTESQVLALYEEARTLFVDRRDEAARLALNRLLESNAAEGIKNKARILSSYLDKETPGFDTLRDRFSYAQVREEPVLYRDCHVIWRGMASNLVIADGLTAFDFLVGYDTRRVLEGLAPVSFGFSIPVNPERPLEILARVVPAADTAPGFRLEGIALNQAGLLDSPRP